MGVESQPDTALPLWDYWVFHRISNVTCKGQVEDMPIAVTRSCTYRYNVGDRRLLLPVIVDEDGDNPLSLGFLPGCSRRHGVQEVFYEDSNVLLGLALCQSC